MSLFFFLSDGLNATGWFTGNGGVRRLGKEVQNWYYYAVCFYPFSRYGKMHGYVVPNFFYSLSLFLSIMMQEEPKE